MTEEDLQTANAPEAGRWEFDQATADAFDDMLQRSIPQYEVMRRAVTDAAVWLADRWLERTPRGCLVVDIGCSRGEALARVMDRLGTRAEYVGLEVSPPMVKAARERLNQREGNGTVLLHDLREGFPVWPVVGHAAAALSVLTLQFIPMEYRQRLLRQVYLNLRPGGGLIVVEKVLGASAELDSMEVDLYYEVKRGNGYSQDAIDRKRLSLEGVLVPATAAWNEDLLRGAGFAEVDCIWAWMNFRAWVALKEERF